MRFVVILTVAGGVRKIPESISRQIDGNQPPLGPALIMINDRGA
jgi:hypothetical protein